MAQTHVKAQFGGLEPHKKTSFMPAIELVEKKNTQSSSETKTIHK